MKRYLLVFSGVFFSIAAVCSLFYFNAEKLIEYEPKKGKTETLTEANGIAFQINGIPEEIPLSESYTMYLTDTYITVLDSAGEAVYKAIVPDKSVFTPSDIQMLERNGISYTVRSELIEILNYISS